MYFLLKVLVVCLFGFIVASKSHSSSDGQDKSSCRKEISSEPIMPSQSKMMDTLYGRNVARRVYDRLQDLDPELNLEVQRIAYDHFWARPGLSIRDKSLVTVISLIALGKEEQSKIHINGFLNSGGTPENFIQILSYLLHVISPGALEKGLGFLKQVLLERGFDQEEVPGSASLHDFHLASVAAHVALGTQEKIVQALVDALKNGISIEDLRNIMIHQIVYCGFPAAMNGFAALKEALKATKML